jgi:acyl CoA:acetate/3-ketoacid CoA transferase beta subunit
MALFDFAPPTHEMRLISLHPGIAIDQVRAMIGWEVCVATDVGSTPAPSAAELVAIRQDLDPEGLYR